MLSIQSDGVQAYKDLKAKLKQYKEFIESDQMHTE